MKFLASKTASIFASLLLPCAHVRAHSWIEQIQVVASNGTMIGATGYPRGNVLRTAKGYGDADMVYQLPPNGGSTAFLPDMNMCKPEQTTSNQTTGSPALKASPGDIIALRYQENGHVTLPANSPNKAENRGTIFIYGTTQPSPSDKLIYIHKVWNAAGTGGDGRGVLLATRNYDDGQCYQINSGTISTQRQKEFPHAAVAPQEANLWCQSDVIIPTTAPGNGTYTLYWVWDWPSIVEGVITVNQTYTTCMDIDMQPGTGTSLGLNFKKGQDLNYAAIESELSTAYIVTTSTSTTPPPEASLPPTGAVTTPTTSVIQATTAPVPVGGSSSGGHGVTVTVTAEARPVTLYVTVTEGAGSSGVSSGASASTSSRSSTSSALSPVAVVPESPSTTSHAQFSTSSTSTSTTQSSAPLIPSGSSPPLSGFQTHSTRPATTFSLPGTVASGAPKTRNVISSSSLSTSSSAEPGTSSVSPKVSNEEASVPSSASSVSAPLPKSTVTEFSTIYSTTTIIESPTSLSSRTSSRSKSADITIVPYTTGTGTGQPGKRAAGFWA